MEKKEKQLIKFLNESNIYWIRQEHKEDFKRISNNQGYFVMCIMNFGLFSVFLKVNPLFISEIVKENKDFLRDFWRETQREIVIDLNNPYLNRIIIYVNDSAYKKVIFFEDISWQKNLFELNRDALN